MPSTANTRTDAAVRNVAVQQSRTAYKYFPGSKAVRSSVESALKGGAQATRQICGERDDRDGSARVIGMDCSSADFARFRFRWGTLWQLSALSRSGAAE
jgi:hypothetical protein